MGKFERYIKNIDKQYGKHMKRFEDRSLEPSKETEALWAKVLKETSEGYEGVSRKGVDLSLHSPMMSVIHYRWGFESRGGDNTINSYADIESISNEYRIDKDCMRYLSGESKPTEMVSSEVSE